MNGWADSLDQWLIVGLIGQGVFSARFLTQWLASERAGRSVVPVSFWWMSLVGSVLLFTYGLKRHEPILVIGQCTGLWIYGRNLYLIRKVSRDVPETPSEPASHRSRPHVRPESATRSAARP